MILSKHTKYLFSTSRWIKRHLDDPYVKRAQKQNYRSRAVFKLEQIDQKYAIFKEHTKILDLGAAPGSWSQYINRKYPKSNLIAVDILQMDTIDGVTFYRGDIQDNKLTQKIMKKHQDFGVIISDIAPQMTGNQDHEQQIELNKMCIQAAGKLLQFNGNLVMKTFIGPFEKQLVHSLELLFEQVYRFKPKASRSESSQQFLVCLKLKQNARKSIQKLNSLYFTGSLSKSQVQRLLQ